MPAPSPRRAATRGTAPPARGRRRAYRSVPSEVRRAWEARLGSPVVRATTQTGGFSPGVAARLVLRDGRRAFLKAVPWEANPDSPAIYRQEAAIARALPPRVPAPRFLWQDERPGWIALAFEDVEGRPPRIPWSPQELRRVLDALARMSRTLTPSPLPLRTAATKLRTTFTCWRRLEDGVQGGPATPADLGPWVGSHFDLLAHLEARWEAASRGRTMLHSDVRADNLLLSSSRVYFVDWPWACVGAPWIDLLLMLPSVAMQGGPPPWSVFDRHPLGRKAPPEGVNAVLAGFTGFLLTRGRLAPPPGLPTLRAFQWSQGREALRWLRCRLEGEDPGPQLSARPRAARA